MSNRIFIGILMLLMSALVVSAEELTHISDWYWRNAQDASMSAVERIRYCDSLLDMSAYDTSNHRLMPSRGEIYVLKGTLLHQRLHYNEAIEVLDSALNLIRPGDSRYLSVLLKRGASKNGAGHFREAILDYSSLINLHKPDSLKAIEASAWAFLSEISLRLGRLDLIDEFLNNAVEAQKSAERGKCSRALSMTALCDIANIRGIKAFEEGDYEEAFLQLKQTEELDGPMRPRSISLVNLGLVYMRQARFDIAEKYFKRALELDDSEYGTLLSVVNLMYLANERQDFETSLNLAHMYGGRIDSTSGQKMKLVYYLNHAEAEESLGHFREAAALQRNFILSVDSLRSPAYVASVGKMLEKIAYPDSNDTGKNNFEQTLLVILLTAIITLLVCTVTVWIIFFRRRSRNSGTSAISSDDATVSGRIERLVDLESFYAGKLGDKDEVSSSDGDGKHLSPRHDLFLHKLVRLHPDLTPNEIELCALLIENLSAKQIAEQTNRSVRTIESIKYMLRKKLGITLPTYSYLKRIEAMTVQEFVEGRLSVDGSDVMNFPDKGREE